MPRISRYKIDKDLEEEIFNQFWYSIVRINNSLRARNFFSDFLTESEQLMLAKRFAAAVLVIRGKTPTEIRNSIHLSYSTIGMVAAWVKNGKPETVKLLTDISKEKNWELVIDKVEALMDKVPPRRGTDWKEKYEKKRKRTRKRYARSVLG